MKSLYHLTSDIEQLERYIESDEFNENDTQWVSDYLDSLEENRDEKLDSYAYLIRRLEAERDTAKLEAAEWQVKEQQRQNRINWLKRNLQEHMLIVGQSKIKTNKFAFSICKNGGMAPMQVDESLLPDEYWREIREPNNSEVRRALESGSEVPGAKLLERGQHLRIR